MENIMPSLGIFHSGNGLAPRKRQSIMKINYDHVKWPINASLGAHFTNIG